MKITVKWLKEHKACEEAQEEFKRLFPRGLVIGPRTNWDRLSTKAENFEDLDGSWLAVRVLPRRTYTKLFHLPRRRFLNAAFDLRISIPNHSRLNAYFALNAIQTYLEKKGPKT